MNYKKNSKEFTPKEKEIISIIMSMVDYDLPFQKRPSENIEKYNLRWCPAMIEENDDTYGCWSFTDPERVYVRPEESQQTIQKFPELKNKIGNKIRSIDVILKYFPDGDKKEEIAFAMYAIENSGHLIRTCLHEMWHKEQFRKSKLGYILSCIATNLFGYERSLSKKWSIEYDVREKVDNEKLRERLYSIETGCRSAISYLNFLYKPGVSDEEKADLSDKLDGMTIARRIFGI